MKTLKSVMVMALVFIAITVKSQTAIDSIQIRQAALDYVEGWFNKDASRVEKACHFEFAKRSILTVDSIDYLATINKSRMDFITLYHQDRKYRIRSHVR